MTCVSCSDQTRQPTRHTIRYSVKSKSVIKRRMGLVRAKLQGALKNGPRKTEICQEGTERSHYQRGQEISQKS